MALLPINPRIVGQLAKATIKNLIDGIVELVTNSDDSYRRLEEEGGKINGEIHIYVNRKKGGICEKLIVKDLAEGMTKDELEKAIIFAGETSGFEKGKSVRGMFGRGLKETIIALGEGEIKTVKNNILSRTKIWLDKKTRTAQYDEQLLQNPQFTGEENGTIIEIKITNKEIKIPKYEKFKIQLERHYALRDIMASPNRKIILTFDDLKENRKHTSELHFSYPKHKKVFEEEKELPSFGDKIKIKIYESEEKLDSPRNNPFGLAGILIKTKGAILDNQLFRFENEEAALYFFGEAICEGLEERLRSGETGIIDPNRAGLEWRHEYCQALEYVLEKTLQPLVEEKKKQFHKKPEKEVKESTKKLLKKLCNELNRIAKEELEEEKIELIETLDKDIETLIIKPEEANLEINKPRAFSIYAPKDLVEKEGDRVYIKSDTSDIRVLSSTIKLEKHPKYSENNLYYRYFKVIGDKIDAEGTITAYLGDSFATAKVKVGPPKKKKKGKIVGRKGGFVCDIKHNEDPNPSQRAEYKEGIIWIFVNFPSVAKFIKSGLEGVETPEGKILLAELVGEAFCKELAIKGLEKGVYPKLTSDIDAFNTTVSELQKKYLHKIQDIIFNYYKILE